MNKYNTIYMSLFKIGLPLIGGNLAMFSLTVVDTAMLGHYNPTALASSVIAGALFFIIFLFGSGFSFAITPLVAAHDARAEDTQVRIVTRMSFWFCLFYSVFSFPILYWSKHVLLVLGQPQEIATLAQSYLRIMSFGLFPALLDTTLRNYLAGLKRTNVVLLATVFGVAFKLFTSWLIIFGNLGMPELGIRGAAISTVGVHTLILLIFIIYAIKFLPRHKLFKNILRFETQGFSRVFIMGFPIGLTYLAESGLFSITAVMMGWLGPIELAAHGIAIQLAAISFMFHLGISQGATTIIGNAYGLNHNPMILRRIAIAILSVTALIAMVAIILFIYIPRELLELFIDPKGDPTGSIIPIGVSLLMIAAIFQLVDGLQAVGLALLRGLQDVRVPLIYAMISYWGIGAPTSYIFGFKLGFEAQGIWFGLVSGLTMASALLLLRFRAKTKCPS